MNAWLPQASYPCGNFSDTSSFKLRRSKGSIGHTFTVRIRTRNQNQTSFYPFVPHEIYVLIELILGHLRYLLTDVPPQPNSPPDNVFRPDRPGRARPWSQKRGDGSKYEYMQSFFAGIFFLESAGELRFIILRRKIGGTSPKGYRDKGTVTLPKKNQV